MPTKNCRIFLVVISLLVATGSFAQNNGGYSVYDSTIISSKRMPQQNEFWNNNPLYNFPAKPRNMWEVGLSPGSVAVSGDIPARIPAFGFEAHVRKALGYVFSLRMQYVSATAKGMNWNASGNYQKNDAWLSAANGGNLGNVGYTPTSKNADGSIKPGQPIFQNYKAKIQDLSIQGLVTLNNVRFHKQGSTIALYGGGGIGFTLYNTKVNSLNATGETYADLFQRLYAGSGVYKNRRDIIKALKDGMDKTYETPAENEGTRRPKIGSNTLKPSGTVIAGVAVKLSRRINIALEDRHTFVKTDLLDGSQWQEAPTGDAVQTRDFDSWNFFAIGINVNIGQHAVEPLWWLNPLDYIYSELNNPRHMKIPKPTYEDEDGDGVIDPLDKEPGTPAGCPVDTHGVTKDTDGDGIPDCKDKQLITPTECQPVDSDGVGKCPEPACCAKLKLEGNITDAAPMCPTDYPAIFMQVTGINKNIEENLTIVANKLKGSPTCAIKLTGYPGASKKQQSLVEKKLTAVKSYLVETLGISADRITADKIIGGGDINTIDIQSN